MAYSKEYKEEILEQMKTKSIKEIANETGISQATLYNWKKKIEVNEDTMEKEQIQTEELQLIVKYIKEKNIEEIKNIKNVADKIKKRKDLQLKLVKKYIKEGNIKEVEKLAEKFPENEQVQIQLAKMYAEKNDLEGVRRLVEQFPENKHVQTQLVKMYTHRKKINENVHNDENSELKVCNTQANILSKIGIKIRAGTLRFEDLEEFKQNYEDKNTEDYNLILIAMYQKLGQKKNALQTLRNVKRQGDYPKLLNQIEESLKTKKVKLFPYEAWEKLIGWKVTGADVQKEIENERERKEELKKLEQQKNREKGEVVKQQEQEVKSDDIKTMNSNKGKIKTNKQTEIVQTVLEKTTKPKIKTNSKKKEKKEEKIVLIKDKLSNKVQDTIEEIEKKYYVKMQQVDSAQSKYIKKYDKLESILECKNTNKRAQMELMLVLINEGYRDVVKEEFPEEDYKFIDEIIKQYYAKTLKPQDAKKQIDEYCI